jgi:hypothetical protein
MAEPEWAKRMSQEFKAGRARKAEEDAKLQGEHTTRKQHPYKLWTDVKGAFRHKAQMFNAALGEEILSWEAAMVSTFTLRRKDVEWCVKGAYIEALFEIQIEVLGKVVPFQVTFEPRTGKYCVLGAGGKPCDPDDIAEALIGEFLGRF